MAILLQGEFELLSGQLEAAGRLLAEAAKLAEAAGSVSVESVALERLAEAEVARGRHAVARALLERAEPLAAASGIPSHLVIRVYGVAVQAAERPLAALRVVRAAERWISQAAHVCQPCSMAFRVEAAKACSRAGELARARRHLATAEQIAGLWQGGPWVPAIWEARAALRQAEAQTDQARALFHEAAQGFDEAQRTLDAARCRSSAAELDVAVAAR
jgi:hypothetical protein